MDLFNKRITSIRNGQKASRRLVYCRLANSVGTSLVVEDRFKLLISSLKILQREGYIRAFNFFKKSKNNSKIESNSLYLVIHLKYDSNGNGVIRSIFRKSTSARRINVSSRSFWQPQTSSGIYILSTTQGLMTDLEARKCNLGGELLFGIN